MAKRRFFIESLINLVKVFKVNCNLIVLGIQEKILFILGIILSTVINEDYQREINICQNLVFVSSENEDTLQQNYSRHHKRKQDDKNKRSQEAQSENICMQATKVVVKKVKIAAEKVQSIKLKRLQLYGIIPKKLFLRLYIKRGN